MAKVAFLASLFCAGAATATFVGWLVALTPIFAALSWWLAVAVILIGASCIVFDDGIRDLLQMEESNAYYGAVAGILLSLVIGVLLAWLTH